MADTIMMYHHSHQHSTPTNLSNHVVHSANPNHSSGAITTIAAPSLSKSASVRSKRKSAVELLAESKPLYVKSECVRDREQTLPQRCGGGGTVIGGGGQGYGTYTRSKSIGATVGYVSGRQGGGGGGGQVNTVMMPQQYMAVVSPSRSLPPLSHHTAIHPSSYSHHRRTIHSSTALITTLGYQPPPPLIPSATNTNSDLLQNRLRQLLVNCTGTTTTTMGGGMMDNCGSSNGATGAGSTDEDALLLSVEQLGPLSPPAEYATDRGGGGNGGGGATTGGGVMTGVGSQRCHKSLPDLHCRGEPSSNKSSNKSLSNRDSGGSSGHYTQHSEPPPPPRQEVRRDSGSSTQHSNASSYYCCQEVECRAAARAQQQAYATAMAAAVNSHVTTYQPTVNTVVQQQQPTMMPLLVMQQQQQYGGDRGMGLGQMREMLMQRDVGVYSGMLMTVGREQMMNVPPVQQQPTTVANSLQPPVNFKRQKCLRYKRDRPILRSKSDISDRYWRPPDPPISHLEQFFEHLGLTSDRYEDMFSLSGRSSASPVFFSDVSTVDSSAPVDSVSAASDYPPTAGNHPNSAGGVCAAAFRPNEPPSIVERNARIIKWLCHCRKAQML